MKQKTPARRRSAGKSARQPEPMEGHRTSITELIADGLNGLDHEIIYPRSYSDIDVKRLACRTEELTHQVERLVSSISDISRIDSEIEQRIETILHKVLQIDITSAATLRIMSADNSASYWKNQYEQQKQQPK